MANELIEREKSIPTLDDTCEVLGQIVRELMAPLMQSMTEFMQHNTEALERLAVQQKVQSDRMEAMEKQIRLNTLVTPTQVRYINDAIRKRARAALAPSGLEDDAKAVKSVSNSIRRNVLSRYGVAALHDIPKHEYSVAMRQVELWDEIQVILDAKKEARKRREKENHTLSELPTRMDGA